jgi:hypothetical protein
VFYSVMREPPWRISTISHPALLLLPLAGVGWWLLGFPPGWGWLIVPVIPTMPVSVGSLISMVAVVVGAYAGLAWLRQNV